MLTVAGGSSIESTLFTKLLCQIPTISVRLPLLSPLYRIILSFIISCQVRALTGLIQPKLSSPKIQIVKMIVVPQISKKIRYLYPKFQKKTL